MAWQARTTEGLAVSPYLQKQLQALASPEATQVLAGIKRGIEKESLRVSRKQQELRGDGGHGREPGWGRRARALRTPGRACGSA